MVVRCVVMTQDPIGLLCGPSERRFRNGPKEILLIYFVEDLIQVVIRTFCSCYNFAAPSPLVRGSTLTQVWTISIGRVHSICLLRDGFTAQLSNKYVGKATVSALGHIPTNFGETYKNFAVANADRVINPNIWVK